MIFPIFLSINKLFYFFIKLKIQVVKVRVLVFKKDVDITRKKII